MGCGTGLTSIFLAKEFEELWRETADFELHNADSEGYLTLMEMIAIKK